MGIDDTRTKPGTETDALRTRREERRLALRLLGEVVGSRKKDYLLYLFSLIAFGGALLVPAYLFREMASLLFSQEGHVPVSWLALLATGSGLLLYTLGYLSTYLGERTRLTMEASLRTRILHTMESLSSAQLESRSRGDFMARVTQDLMEVEIFLAEDLPGYIRQTAVLLGVGGLMLFHSGWTALPVFAAGLALAVISLHQNRKLIPVFRELRVRDSEVVQQVIEGYEGRRTLRSFGAEKFFRKQFDEKVDAVRTIGLRAGRTYATGIATGHGLSQCLMVLCLGWYTVLFANGTITREDALVYPFFLGLFYSAVQTLSSSVYRWNRFFVEGARVAALIFSPQRSVAETEIPVSTPSKETILEDLVVAIPGGRHVGPVSLKLERTRLTVIQGRSGSGKSTLLETLAGLRPAHAVNGYLPQSQHVAFVEQNPYLFSGTLRANVTLGAAIPDSRIERVMAALSLDDLLLQRGGLDGVLSDRGNDLSEGERYRIAMVRALVLDRPILLLDEPFAALENDLVERVSVYLTARKATQAVVIATHWVPNSLEVDRIVNLSPQPESYTLGSPRIVELRPI